MRVLVLGAGGMLGHKLVQTFAPRFETWATVRTSPAAYTRFGLDPDRLIGGVDGAALDTVVRAFAVARPDAVVNAIGIVKQLPLGKDAIASLTINSLLPHRLGQLCSAAGARLIQVSTDCVFSGRRGGYRETDPPDPEDLYGRSKLLGEVDAPHLTIRTSIVGRELTTAHGLLEWFLSNRGRRVQGYSGVVFSGLPTGALAQLLADVIERHPGVAGLHHVSVEPIDKHQLLTLWRDAYGLPIEIEPFDAVRNDRSLDSTRFRAATGFDPPSWPTLVAAMAADSTPYAVWREPVAAPG
jgi:dTDP-4-dehydrorhamnose reductase